MHNEMHKKYILPLIPNRVRRNYKGGALLETLSGNAPIDNNMPEDWMASTTKAKNPGMSEISGEGLAQVIDENKNKIFLRDLLEKYPEHYLGMAHYKRFGANLGFLAKLLDSSMRLHVQAHPTARFAQKYLNSRWGKLETYVILGHRDGYTPYIRLGFQHPPTPTEWKRIVMEQDIEAMDTCFEKIPVKEGEVWIVPGGLPHAIGEGLLVMEVMEPTDFVVRCEFEREGIIVPPEARFMGFDPDFVLQIFDYTPMQVKSLYDKCRISPEIIYRDKNIVQERLIGSEQTDCFHEYRVEISGNSKIPINGKISIVVVLEGTGIITASGERVHIHRGSKLLIAASAAELTIQPEQNSILKLLLCTP